MNDLEIEMNGTRYYNADIIDHVVGMDVVDAVTLKREIEAKNKLIIEFRERLTKQHVNFLNDFFYEIENGIIFKEDFIIQLRNLEQLLINNKEE